MTQENEYQTILSFVKGYRSQRNITPTPGYKSEPSGEAFGEGYLLLFRQLVYTSEGTGGWLEIKDPAVRRLVLDEIEKILNS